MTLGVFLSMVISECLFSYYVATNTVPIMIIILENIIRILTLKVFNSDNYSFAFLSTSVMICHI